MSIHLKLKVLGETVYLIGLARSDVRPLARARQEMLTDMPFKLHEMEGRNHSSGGWGAITFGGVDGLLKNNKCPLPIVSQGSPHFHFTNRI